MGRTVIAEEKILPDLLSLAKIGGYIPGLILGQCSGQKDFVVHLARTSLQNPSQSLEDGNVAQSPSEKLLNESVLKLSDIPESWLADHAKQVTRMLPGGMWVLGIFVVGPGDVFNDTSAQAKLRSALAQVCKGLSSSPYTYGNSPSEEKLIFHLSTDTKKFSCKSVDISQISGGLTLKPVDWKFHSGLMKWHQLDCHYDCEQVIPYLITEDRSSFPLKRHLQEILTIVNESVNKAVCTIDGEIKDNSDSLEVTDKKKKGKPGGASKSSSKEVKTLEVNLYSPYDLKETYGGNGGLDIVTLTGEMKCSGLLSSRVFLYQKATVEEAVKAVKEDIVRSLSSRLEMHWDSLVEDEIGSPEDKVVLHEPPRRVLINLPHSKVALSDYLFPGEGVSESLISLQELLGLRLTESALVKDFEGQTDPTQLYNFASNNSDTTTNERTQNSFTASYYLICGVAIASLVLLASIIIQYAILFHHTKQ